MEKRKRVTPLEQLMKELKTKDMIELLEAVMEVMNEEYKEAFCIAAVGYIKYGIRCPFGNCVLWALFNSFCDMLDRNH